MHIQLISILLSSNRRCMDVSIMDDRRCREFRRGFLIQVSFEARRASRMALVWADRIRRVARGVEQGMNYKTVMVGLALDRSNDACLRVAGDIAERFGARIIGVAASDLRPPLYFAEGAFAQKLLDDETTALGRRLSELEAEFRAAVEKRATAVAWRSARALPVPYLLQQARAADIIVIGARTETLVDPCVAPDPSDLLMQAGRPLIVVPPDVEWLDLRSVLIAWKDVREARRAVFDAL